MHARFISEGFFCKETRFDSLSIFLWVTCAIEQDVHIKNICALVVYLLWYIYCLTFFKGGLITPPTNKKTAGAPDPKKDPINYSSKVPQSHNALLHLT